ncbi:hypothetical protein EMMF5_004541 [Cystobasidiomycetes sp. EMM_F5]
MIRTEPSTPYPLQIGASIVKTFREAGYKIATSSRKAASSQDDSTHHIQLDLSDPSAVAGAFDEVASKMGAPDVVVYNAAALAGKPGPKPLEATLKEFTDAININHTSVFEAAKAATDRKKNVVFIFTGNGLNTKVMVSLLAAGAGKTATLHLLEGLSAAYGSDGARFYYADERRANGDFMYNAVNGPSHAKFYLSLAQSNKQLPVQATFVDGEYVKF